MKLYSYVVKVDSGFAPNPERGWCTLACCKPVIRRCAKIGDWVVGTGSVNNVGYNKIVYVMAVEEKLTFKEYSKDKRFQKRKDNIYYYKNSKMNQKENPYHGKLDMEHDKKGIYVLISRNFSYFGKNAVENKFKKIIKKGPSHKSKFDEKFVAHFVKWANSIPKGKRGEPSEESSYEQRC